MLHFVTVGLYSCFWFFARARELRTLTGRSLTPWLWFLVPLVAPAQFVAVPRFIKAWDAVGQPHGAGKWSKWIVPVTLAVFLLSVAFPFQEAFADLVRFEAFMLGWLLCWAGLFCAMDARVNSVKRSIPEAGYTGNHRGYAVHEWVLLACGSPVPLILIAVWAFDELGYEYLEGLPAGSDYVDAGGAFRFPIVGNGWRRVEIGKYSDVGAALEIEGPATFMYFLVFEHGRNTSISDVVSMRMDESREATGGVCKESRTFVGDRPVVKSYTECKGRFAFDPSLDTVTVFDVDGRVYELYGRFNPPSRSFDRLAVDFRRIARGFEPL